MAIQLTCLQFIDHLKMAPYYRLYKPAHESYIVLEYRDKKDDEAQEFFSPDFLELNELTFRVFMGEIQRILAKRNGNVIQIL